MQKAVLVSLYLARSHRFSHKQYISALRHQLGFKSALLNWTFLMPQMHPTIAGPFSACWQTVMRNPPVLVHLMRKNCSSLSLRGQWGRRDPPQLLKGKCCDCMKWISYDAAVRILLNRATKKKKTGVWLLLINTIECYFHPSVLWMRNFLEQNKINCADITLQMATAYITDCLLYTDFGFSWHLNAKCTRKCKIKHCLLFSSNLLLQHRGWEDWKEDFEICGQNR